MIFYEPQNVSNFMDSTYKQESYGAKINRIFDVMGVYARFIRISNLERHEKRIMCYDQNVGALFV